jgi:cytidylate kinase
MFRTPASGAISRVSVADEPFVIAIDGPAASGKSSTARLVAERLGMHHADSGALYRAATLARVRQPGAPESWNPRSVLHEVSDVTLVRRGTTSFEIRLSGKVVEHELHEPAITAVVSLVAKMEPVRAWVNELMHSCAAEGPIVVDGRDMGTAVFPGAQLKVFLIAHADERARRRLRQRFGREPEAAEVAGEAAALKERDAKDAAQTREPPDAVVIDTTHLTQDEQVERIVELAKNRLARISTHGEI